MRDLRTLSVPGYRLRVTVHGMPRRLCNQTRGVETTYRRGALMSQRTCSLLTCELPALARGWCSTHYARWKAMGDVQADRPIRHQKPGAPCVVEGCDRLHVARGYCAAHWQRWQRLGDPGPADITSGGPIVPGARRGCDFEGCDRKHVARGFCAKHYNWWQKNHDETRPRCAVEECPKAAKRRGWCEQHYGRWQKYGNPIEPSRRQQKKPCTVDYCDRLSMAKGLCEPHYEQTQLGTGVRPIRGKAAQLERDDQGRKQCRDCREWLPEPAFGKFSRNPDGLSGMCRPCINNRHLGAYGLTRESYDALVVAQGGGCAICGRQCPSGRRLAIDHDHRCCPGQKSCGKCVRGILCGPCNQALGQFRDNPDLMMTAALYLEQRRVVL